jgi:phenylalanyl-tRNA synthetase beta chain
VVEDLGLILMPTESKECASHQHSGRTAALMLHGKKVGVIYELNPQIKTNFDLKTNVVLADIDLETIHDMKIDRRPKYQELPKYPAIQLDVSILIPKKKLAENYSKAIQKTDKTLVKKIELVDEYEGKNIGKDKRSLTYSITYQSPDRTLTDEEVNTIHKKVIANLKSEGAVIRD